MTPLQISILLHYYVSPTDYRNGDFSAPAVKEAMAHFLEKGMLCHSVKRDVNYVITDGGQYFVYRLCRVPLPVVEERWVFPDGWEEDE